jgi:uncharacterized membrane protein
VIETVEQLSVAVATPSSSSSRDEQAAVVTFRSAGIVNVGGVVSPLAVMVITCVQEAEPMALVAVQVIVVWPAGYAAIKGRSSLRLKVVTELRPPVTGVPISPAVRVF